MIQQEILKVIQFIEKYKTNTDAFKNWKFGFYIPDLVRAMIEDRVLIEYENGEITGIIIFEPKIDYLYINHILTIVPRTMRILAQKLQQRFDFKAVVATRKGKLRIYDTKRLTHLIEKVT